MDNENYEQYILTPDLVEKQVPFLAPNVAVTVLFVEGTATGIDMPASVVLGIKELDAGIKGDTATNATKRAVLETGHEVKVPLFINADEKIKIDTRTGEFQGRA